MARYDTFTFRVNKEERQMLETLASRLQRSQSDAVRLLVREAVAQLEPERGQPVPTGQGERHESR